MAIKRLQIPEGAPIWGPTNANRLATRLWRERLDQVEILKPGDYDVTPEPVKRKASVLQQLTVMENGTALFRTYVAGSWALTKMNVSGPGSVEKLPEGRGDVAHIPQDIPGRLILSQRPERANRGRLFLFDVIIWSRDADDLNNELAAATTGSPEQELANLLNLSPEVSPV